MVMEAEREVLINLLNSSSCRKIMKEYLLRISKNSEMSEIIRKDGNEMFMSGGHSAELHEQIWKYYSMSIAVAEPDSEVLAIAYGNRSAVLIHLCKYEACIKDIDRAVGITKNTNFKIKMLCRKVKCLNELGSCENKNTWQKAESLLEEVTDKATKKLLEDLVKKTKLTLDKSLKPKTVFKDKETRMLEALHKKYTINDFSSVDIQYNEQFGRHLVANRNIKPGEVIYIEKPFTQVLNMKKLHAYCSHCFVTTWANIPCDHCSWTMFCSEECKKDAWEKYHDIECSVYAMSKEDDKNDAFKQLAIRALILGIKEAGSIENLKAELETFDECTDITKGFINDGKIQSIGFKSIYALANEVSDNALEIHKSNTARVLRSLARNTSFFGEDFNFENSRGYKTNENAIFIGSLILRLSKISQLNSHQMWNGNYVCRNGFDRIVCWVNECCSRGVYIAPITGLLNHNCDSNARRCYSNDHTVIMYAIKPIKKGDQIFDCYQQEFYELEISARRKLLRHNYNFHCDCIACKKRWPHLIDLFHFNKQKMRQGMSATELQLAIEYKDLVPSTLNENSQYDEKTIAHLGKGIEKGLKHLNQPSFTTVNLIICINTIFERLYGIMLRVPAECNNVLI